MELRLELISFSFAAGFWAFLNPCGFAMLPAYVASYLHVPLSKTESRMKVMPRGIALGTVVSCGFLSVFTLVGIGISVFSGAFGRYYPWIGVAIGVLLIVFGVFMMVGKNLLAMHSFQNIAGRINKVSSRSQHRGLRFYYMYGVAYALASLGCAFPIFIPVVISAFSSSWMNGIVQFAAYALGMAFPMMVLSLFMVFSNDLVQRALPALLRSMQWLNGIVVIGAGIFLIWYYLYYSRLIEL